MAKEQIAEDLESFIDELKPGTKLLHGQYTIVKFINSGGFGITYLAKNSLDREIVIKECFPGSFCRRHLTTVGARSRAHQGEFATIVKLFVQEAKSLAKMIHPNIVGVHQVFEDNETAYIAMDYIDGRDLLEIIETDRASLTPKRVYILLKKMLSAVSFIHENGLLHRDISPDNILVNRQGEPILIDFGAARQQATVVGGKALSAMRVVKDGYSPQEFYVSGSTQNDSSDLYALAATFYHAIAGHAPPNSQGRLLALAEEKPDPYVPLDGRIDGYPDGFLAAIDMALRVLPKYRTPTARAWLDLIDNKPELKVVPLKNRDDPIAETVKALVAEAAVVPAAVTEPENKAQVAPQVAPKPEPRRAATGGRRMPVLLGTAALILLSVGIGGIQMMSSDASVPSITTPAAVAPVVEAGPQATAEEAALAVDQTAAAVAAAESDPVDPEAEIARTATLAEPETPATMAVAAPDQSVADPVAAIASVPAVTPAPEPAAEPVAEAAAEPAAEPESVAKPAIVPTANAVAEPVVEPVAEPVAAALAAPEDSPVVASADAAPAVLSNQFTLAAWDMDIPFSARKPDAEPDGFPIIATVTDSAAISPLNDWIAPGVIVYSLNGHWVSDQASIEGLLAQTTEPGEDQFLIVPAKIKADPAGAFQEKSLAVPIARNSILRNGITVKTVVAEGDWRPTVTEIASEESGGLRVGDVILGETTLGSNLSGAHAFEVVVQQLARLRAPTAEFTVLRNGEQAEATMALALNE